MKLSWIVGTFLLVQTMNPHQPLKISKDGETIAVIERADYSFEYPGLPLPKIQKLNEFFDHLDQRFSVPAENASLDKNGQIIPEKIGTRIHRQVLTEQFYQFYFDGTPTSLELPLVFVHPKVDSELLGNISSKRIGRYVTSFNASNKARVNNIQLAVKAINNYVLFPGETFSFNRVVGNRTAAKGYLKAKIIVRGEYSEGIGGGICQVSSTLFNAVDNAGLKIVQRFSHSRRVPYIPPGRDATVSWYGPDFVFKNKYNQPVLIQAKTLGNLLIIKLYSSDVVNDQPREIPKPLY